MWLVKSGGNAITIISVVVVGVAVGVDITEIVAVVVIRGTKPPIDRTKVNTNADGNQNDTNFIKTSIFLFTLFVAFHYSVDKVFFSIY